MTGISTGALTAPFAFLGPDYDPQLRAVYTETPPSQILTKRGLTAALFDDAMADNEPLFKTISRYVDDRMLAGIAASLRRGPPAADRLDRSRRAGAGDLEHRRDRQERPSAGRRHDPPHPAGLGRDPRCVSAVHDRGDAGRQDLPGDACRRRRLRPDLPLSLRADPEPRAAQAHAVSRSSKRVPSSSATAGSIRNGRRSSAARSASPAGRSTP